MLVVLNCTIDKNDRYGENNTHKFIGAVSIMLCLDSSWIIGFSIYGEGRT